MKGANSGTGMSNDVGGDKLTDGWNCFLHLGRLAADVTISMTTIMTIRIGKDSVVPLDKLLSHLADSGQVHSATTYPAANRPLDLINKCSRLHRVVAS